ncbi:MAG: hypothetical protein JOS17DRAFT_757479 [Linnemannia elongata]|nr:MAG: hypothetical protein JOS17DRAFT_757479 [Linnemannia elongata]
MLVFSRSRHNQHAARACLIPRVIVSFLFSLALPLAGYIKLISTSLFSLSFLSLLLLIPRSPIWYAHGCKTVRGNSL